jgi:hypothetical protein
MEQDLAQGGFCVRQCAQEFLSPQETAREVLTFFSQHPREVRFAGPLLGSDPDASEPALRARLEDFFRGARFRPANELRESQPRC